YCQYPPWHLQRGQEVDCHGNGHQCYYSSGSRHAAPPVIDATGQDVSGRNGAPRAAWEIQGNYYLIQNLEFRNDRNGNNRAGIRVLFADTTTVSNCKITYCDMGMMSSSNKNLVVEKSEVAYNGTPK